MDDTKKDNSSRQLLFDEETAATACGIGKTLFRQLDADGSLPEPCRLHTRKLWSARQLELWCILNCPPRTSEIWKKALQSLRENLAQTA